MLTALLWAVATGLGWAGHGYPGMFIGIALLTVVWGFVVTGSPGTARLQKFDDRRVEDLQTIEDEIENACLGGTRYSPMEERALQRPLPATLEDVVELATLRRPDIRDPETGKKYEYDVLDESRYRLCATFHFSRDEENLPIWNHEAGRQCFEFDVLRP